MRALVYTAPHGLELRAEPEPRLAPGIAIVKVDAVGICGSDMHAYHGFDDRRPPPLILGHEAAGVVVDGAMKGARVTVNPLATCGACPACRGGQEHLCPDRQIISMPPRQGAFAEYVAVPERNLVALPDSFDIVKAALAEPLAVSYHAVTLGLSRLRRPAAAARTLVLGGGAIGLGAALVLAMAGAASVIIAETNASRRRTAQAAGGFSCYAPGERGEPEPGSIDLVIDAVGAAATRAAASRLISPGGVIVHAGLLPGLDGLDVRRITLQEITFVGTYCYTHADFRETIEAMIAGRLGRLDWFEERPLSDGAAAFAAIDAGSVAAAKIILRP